MREKEIRLVIGATIVVVTVALSTAIMLAGAWAVPFAAGCAP